MSFTQDLFTQRRNYEDGNVRIGQLDRIWYDEHRNAFYIGNGTTPGGRLIGGNTYVAGAHGAFYDVTTQTISNIALAYQVPIGNTTSSSGVSLSNSNIVVSTSGVYDIQYSIQFTNADNFNQDIDVWLRINNIDVPDSNSIFTIHSKTGSTPGKLIAVTPLVTPLNSGDTAQIMWNATNTGVAITTFAAQTNPTIPRTPGVIVFVNQIA